MNSVGQPEQPLQQATCRLPQVLLAVARTQQPNLSPNSPRWPSRRTQEKERTFQKAVDDRVEIDLDVRWVCHQLSRKAPFLVPRRSQRLNIVSPDEFLCDIQSMLMVNVERQRLVKAFRITKRRN